MSRRFACLMFCTLLLAVSVAFGESHARIVRLSFVEGDVQLERPGQSLGRAILNTPIVEGTRIVTGADGLAEVEFESESALRITSDTDVKFTQLLLSDNGTRVTQIAMTKGVAYLQTAAKGDDSFHVVADSRSILVRHDSLVRFDVNAAQLRVANLKGEIRVEDDSQPFSMRKHETLVVDLKKPTEYQIARGVDDERFDKWNKERQDYSDAYASNQGYGGPDRGYGLQDLNYYGQFLYANGLGYVWQPYGYANAMVNWDPYSNGAWMFYPGAGYMWASAYPWGWLPYHYGSWAYANSNLGWVWVPGRYVGPWYGAAYLNAPSVMKAPEGWKPGVPPETSLTAASAPTVAVGETKPIAIPGGRIPPDFASVVPGRPASAARINPGGGAFVTPTAANTASRGHVFAVPAEHPNFGGAPPLQPVGVREPAGLHGGDAIPSAAHEAATTTAGAAARK